MISMSIERSPENRIGRISIRGHVGAPKKPARLRPEDRFPWPGPRRRLMRYVLAALVPVPGSRDEYAPLNIYGRPVGRMSGPQGGDGLDPAVERG
jgi:hypothetical protein